MHRLTSALLWTNIFGGIAVLGSYVLGLAVRPGSGGALWGGVPQQLRPLYAVGMLLAALGYLAFTYFLLFRLDPDQARIGRGLDFRFFGTLYTAILVPSALWMPLTLRMVEEPRLALWMVIRLVLVAVGLAALGMVVALLSTRPRQPRWAYWIAVAGAVLFFLHTGILDAIVWPLFFPQS
jgi:hypothetical protein